MSSARSAERPVVLVVAPMPVFPTSAGNRRRLLTTCEFLKSAGYDIDFAYLAHEDQIYRRYNQNPPTDMHRMVDYFRAVYLIEIAAPIRLKTGASAFGIDDWCPPELDHFVRDYFARSPATTMIVINYIWLSRALTAAPENCLKLIDTHDRFAGRKDQYLPFRTEANFFHTNLEGEARGLDRADLIVAIQPVEQAYFAGIARRETALLLPEFAEMRPFRAPASIRAVGFMGHGNDANLQSIGRFAGIWGRRWQPGWPELLIAGEICHSLPATIGPGIRLLGYVDRLDDFFDQIDLVVAPISFGTGLKMKVVEALSYGMPVIGSSIGFEGIETQDPDHRLDDPEAMVDRILTLSADGRETDRLSRSCADVFRSYRARGAQAAASLAAHLHSHQPPAGAATSLGAEMANVTTEDREATLWGWPLAAESAATLVATEFLPYSSDRRSSASPSRRRWHLDDASAPTAIAGRSVSLAPLVTTLPRSATERDAGCQAVEILYNAAPDWSAAAEGLAFSEGGLRVSFCGPAFLMKLAVPPRVFAIDQSGGAHEVTSPIIRHLAVASRAHAALGARCGDTPISALSIGSGPCDFHPDGGLKAIVVIAHALLGRIDVPLEERRTEKRR